MWLAGDPPRRTPAEAPTTYHCARAARRTQDINPEELKRAALAMKNDDSTLGVKAMVKRLKEMGDVDVI